MLFLYILLELENDLGEVEMLLSFIANFYHKVSIKGTPYYELN